MALRLPRLAPQLTSGAAAFTSRLMTNAPSFAPLLATLTPGRKTGRRRRVTSPRRVLRRRASLPRLSAVGAS